MAKKKHIVSVCILFFLAVRVFATDYISISDALAKKLIRCEITGNSESPHYIKPLKIGITNLQGKALNLKIETGRMFLSVDTGFQNLIVTEQKLIALEPDKKESHTVYAMCTQMSNRCPADEVSYKTSNMANEKLLALANFIEENKYHTPIGQSAVWCLTDNLSLDEIAGFDTIAVSKLQKFVSKLTGQPIPPKQKGDYRTDYYSQNVQIKISGDVGFDFEQAAAVTVSMFNKDGIVVRELYNNPVVQPGKHEFHYEFDASVYTDPVYYIKLILDGEIKITRTMDLGRIRNKYK